jgi:hypothetical protein
MAPLMRSRIVTWAVRVVVAVVILATMALAVEYWRTRQVREALHAAFTPVQITNCLFEVLLVNKRIATANPSVITRGPTPLDSPNSPLTPDCQASPGGSEPRRVAQWGRRIAGVIGWRFFGIPFSLFLPDPR